MARYPGKTYQSPRSVRAGMARMLSDRMQAVEDLEESEFKTRIWAFTQILSALRLERDIRVEEQYEEIIRRLDAKGL